MGSEAAGAGLTTSESETKGIAVSRKADERRSDRVFGKNEGHSRCLLQSKKAPFKVFFFAAIKIYFLLNKGDLF